MKGDSKKLREGGRLPHSSRLREKPDSNSSTSHRPRGGCNRLASARDGVDGTEQAVRSWGKNGKVFISAKWRSCILYALQCIFCFAFLAVSLVIIPATEGNKNYPLKMGATETRKPEEQLLSWPWEYLGLSFKRVLFYRNFLMYVGPQESNEFRVMLTSASQYLAPHVLNWFPTSKLFDQYGIRIVSFSR